MRKPSKCAKNRDTDGSSTFGIFDPCGAGAVRATQVMSRTVWWNRSVSSVNTAQAPITM